MKKIIRLTENDLKKLVRRIIKESEESADLVSVNNELSNAGLPTLSNQDIESGKLPMSFFTKSMEMDIEPEKNQNEKENVKKQLLDKIKTVDCEELKNAKRTLLGFLKRKKKNKVQEQVETITILGLSINPIILIAIGVIILGYIIIRLLKRDTGGYGCRGRSKSITGYRSKLGFGY